MKRQSLRRWLEMGEAGATVEGEPVQTLAQAEQFFRAILDRHELRQEVTDAGAHRWLAWLVRGHPDHDELCPTPITRFVVHSNRDIGHLGDAKGFSVFVAGAARPEPFSFHRALTGAARGVEDKQVKALRAAVRDQEADIRKTLAVVQCCPVLRIPIELGKNAQLVYLPPFKVLAYRFFRDCEIDTRKTEITERLIYDRDGFDPSFAWELKDDALRRKWLDYFGEHARVQLMSVAGRQHLEDEQREQDAVRGVFTGLRS